MMASKYQKQTISTAHYFRLLYPLVSTYPQQLNEQLESAMEYLKARMTVTNVNGSGWVLEENQALVLEVVEYQPLTGSSYLELPPDVFNSKAVINIKNDDQQCFKWSVLAALHPQAKDPQRVSKYQDYKDELNFEGIECLVPIHQISKFEKNNPGMSVTVIGIDKPQSDKDKPSKKKKKKAYHSNATA